MDNFFEEISQYFKRSIIPNIGTIATFTAVIITSGFAAYRLSQIQFEQPKPIPETTSIPSEKDYAFQPSQEITKPIKKTNTFGELLPPDMQILSEAQNEDTTTVVSSSTQLPKGSQSSKSQTINTEQSETLSCRITLWGKLYDVTNLRKTHSGGDTFVCGTDMSTSYQMQHGIDLGRMSQYLISTIIPTISPPVGTITPTATLTPEPTTTPTTTLSSCIITLWGKLYEVGVLKTIHSGRDIFACGTDMSISYQMQHGINLSRMQQYFIGEITPTPIVTSTLTPTPTMTSTPSSTPTPSQTSTPVPTNTITPTPTSSSTPTVTPTTSPSVTSTPTPSPTPTPTQSSTPTPTPTSSGMTESELAIHNKTGDCYIAYSGKVYNVSSHKEWNNCRHHGISGGIDITSVFPHPTSYLNSLTIISDYSG
ncbi:hypothetical protein KC717_06105 [Candidatus Dojkabacteria bacterium]|uniref:Cytochrome b5 heme-binding domain-containing protein n=1 Tax=Candidatus Dojkabacteria bacterium TaxID=2099670 RepID=A0A955L996_9BACT|nr:hypothetical protein [Candidatus Dojkabacteria bacterium]